jgi:hypothetical protein
MAMRGAQRKETELRLYREEIDISTRDEIGMIKSRDDTMSALRMFRPMGYAMGEIFKRSTLEYYETRPVPLVTLFRLLHADCSTGARQSEHFHEIHSMMRRPHQERG